MHSSLFSYLLIFQLFTELIFQGPCIKSENPNYLIRPWIVKEIDKKLMHRRMCCFQCADGV